MSEETAILNPTKRWPLAEARRMAEHVQRELAGLCERIELAGSIRRQRETVHDIDLVLLVKPGQRAALEARVKRSANTRVLKNGPQNMVLILHNGMQVDLYFAVPEEHTLMGPIPTNYGMRLLAMTGSKQHNIKLASLAKDRGLHFHPYKGLMRRIDGKAAGRNGGGAFSDDPPEAFDESKWEVFCGESEAAIFEALGLDWIKPEDRETDAYFEPPKGTPLPAAAGPVLVPPSSAEKEGK